MSHQQSMSALHLTTCRVPVPIPELWYTILIAPPVRLEPSRSAKGHWHAVGHDATAQSLLHALCWWHRV